MWRGESQVETGYKIGKYGKKREQEWEEDRWMFGNFVSCRGNYHIEGEESFCGNYCSVKRKQKTENGKQKTEIGKFCNETIKV